MTTWQPSASNKVLRQRAKIIASIRHFFSSRDYLEVETPIVGRFGVTDPYLNSIKATIQGDCYYLQTSPESHMKRLLAGGIGPIFQISRVFRDDELGRWHNPEFSLLEWYQLGIDHHQLMDEVDLLLQHVLQTAPMIRTSYQQLFLDELNLDPLDGSIKEMRAIVSQHKLDGVLRENECDRDQHLFLLMSHVIEPRLARFKIPIAVYDFPPTQAALAKIEHGVGQRFEVFFRGVELANGFHELTDATEQKERFLKDITHPQADPNVRPDEYLLGALISGLPECSGVALGVDRLLALALDQRSVAESLSFDFSRC